MEDMSTAELCIRLKAKSSRKQRSSEQELHFKHLYSTTAIPNGSSLTKQMKLGPKIKEMFRRKLNLGQKIVRLGGAKKVFTSNFSVNEGEILLKSFRCYLSTTSGPISGFLFISTDKVAFCSEKSFKFSTTNGQPVNTIYNVSIPLIQINRVRESKDVNIALKKYIELVTRDDFDFWFMGFRNHQRTFMYIQQEIPKGPPLFEVLSSTPTGGVENLF